MTSSMLRRQLKNLVQNYSEAEVKVREATSNDPWGPSSSQMADISDLTYNVVACNEIMTMLWKRLKDDRNWRHILKSLTLLEYLLKTGDERVLLKMKDNIYIVKALTEYRFLEKDGKDQGVNVREKAKVVLVLMEDDDKLKEERDFAFKTREKTSKSSAASSTDTLKDPNYKPVFVAGATGLPSLANIPSVADLAATFEKKKEVRLKQEAEKKEQVRRAKMTEDELQWEDAGKGGEVQNEAWGEEKPEEETDAWGAPIKPKEAEGPWGSPDRPETTDTEMAEGANGEATFEDGEDPFGAPEEVTFTAEDSADPFNAPTDKSPEGKPEAFTPTEEDAFASKEDDLFNAPKDDPFTSSKSDPFASGKDDPFNTPKDDSFKTQTQTEDPFGAPKDDPFTSAKSEDPFNTSNEDPFGAPKDDPFNTAKEDPFNKQEEDPFGAPKDDAFTAAKNSDPFDDSKEDPFGMPKNDPFTSAKEEPKSPPPKDDPFSAPSKPAEDPFAAPTSPSGEDAFGAPTSPPKEDPFATATTDSDPFAAPPSPPKEDPFSTPSRPSDDPFAAPTSPPPKDDPFAAPTAAKDSAAVDPFSAPTASSPQDSADAWGAASSSQETKAAGDPWGDGASALSPVSDSDPFGDTTKPDNDPWGAPAAAPVNTDDAWGSPAPDTLSSPSDPFGAKGDAWAASSNTTSQGTGRRSGQEEALYKKTASFLGSAGASLVDLDDLFSSNPKPKRGGTAFVANAAASQIQATGALNTPLPPSFPSASPVSHFGSNLSASGATSQSIAPPYLQPQMLDLSNFVPVQTHVLPGSLQSVYVVQTTQPGALFGDFVGLAGNQQTGPPPPMGSGVSNPLFPCISETNRNYNPFL